MSEVNGSVVPEHLCEVCGQEPAVGVAAVPGVPYSAAFGVACLAAHAYPYWILVGNTATVVVGEVPGDPLEQCADWWQEMVANTLEHLEISRERFNDEVRAAARELRNP